MMIDPKLLMQLYSLVEEWRTNAMQWKVDLPYEAMTMKKCATQLAQILPAMELEDVRKLSSR